MKVFEIYIKTTPELLWEAITDPELPAPAPPPELQQAGSPGGDEGGEKAVRSDRHEPLGRSRLVSLVIA